MIEKIYLNDVILTNVVVLDVGNENICKKSHTIVNVYGSNKRAIINNNSYEGYKRKIKLLVDDYEKITDIVNKIEGVENKISFNNEKYYYKYDCLNGWENVRLKDNKHYILDIELYIHPFKYFKEDTVETLTSSGTINNIGNVYCEPRITIYGEGSCKLTIGEQSIVLKSVEEKAVIECEHGKQNVLNKDGELNNSNLEKGEFFEIKSGVNAVVLRGNIRRVDIEMRCRNR